MNTLLTLSGLRLAALVREGSVRSEELVRLHAEAVDRVNPVINAVVATRYDAALEEARRVDAAVAEGRGDLPPFAGVPCTIKECLALEGMPHTSGLVSRQGLRPERDATVVARIRAAGAIPLGVTNTSELCMWMETSNRLYGRTNNPYDPGRIVGGSSGGEGAVVGAGASPFGLGSDIGGSIRMPAFFNGVFGHKPSGGLVPGTGQHPIAENEALRYLTTGPLTRRAEDLMPILRLIAGPDGEDTGTEAMPLGDPAAVAFPALRVVDIPDNGLVPVSPDLREAQRRVRLHLESLGCEVVQARPAALRRSFDIWSSMLAAAGGTSFRDMLGTGGTTGLLTELGRWALRRSPHTLPALVLALLEDVPHLGRGRLRHFVEMGHALRAEIDELLGPRGVLLFPSYACAAPRHWVPMFPPFYWVYTGILNVLQIPVTQVPLGLNTAGLPIGLQVGARRGADHLTIAVALELERAFGGWVPPPDPAASAAGAAR